MSWFVLWADEGCAWYGGGLLVVVGGDFGLTDVTVGMQGSSRCLVILSVTVWGISWAIIKYETLSK